MTNEPSHEEITLESLGIAGDLDAIFVPDDDNQRIMTSHSNVSPKLIEAFPNREYLMRGISSEGVHALNAAAEELGKRNITITKEDVLREMKYILQLRADWHEFNQLPNYVPKQSEPKEEI